MKRSPKKSVFFILLLTNLFAVSAAQGRLEGIISDGKVPLAGATVSVSPINRTIITDERGFFFLDLPSGTFTLEVNHIGFEKLEKKIEVVSDSTLHLTLDLTPLNANEKEIVVLGSRSFNRSVINSPVPVDVLRLNDLRTTGQPSIDKMLQFKLPSFNTVNLPVSDATTLLDPYEIRSLGPTRTLVLINGKRKNLSSLVYFFGVNRGETGADLSAIPVEAIRHVEVLRDGSSAQYGSDAIAGVINIVLKNDTVSQSVNLSSGITHKGDGFSKTISYQGSSSIMHKGSINFTMELTQTDNAVRSGLVDPVAEKAAFGGTADANAKIDAYLKRFPTANNINGTGANTAGKFVVNMEYPLTENSNFYMNAAYCAKRVVSNANHRTPYWRTDAGLLHTRIPGATNYTLSGDPLYDGYIGYMPTFEGDLTDFNGTAGLDISKGNWKQEASLTVGGNQQLYTLNNTINRSLGASSPTSFKAGGYGFRQLVGNYDVRYKASEQFSIAFGSEFRKERFQIFAGDTASSFGEGSNSFPGISYNNQSENSRYNIGTYVDMTWDASKRLLLNGAARFENYSDFGNAFVWKLSSHYKLADGKLNLRGSVSTGLRAPTIHQVYLQVINAQFINGDVDIGGIFKNGSKEVSSIGIPRLKPEKSLNTTLGLGWKPMPKMNLTLDYYNIQITNRIILSTQIYSYDPASLLYQILKRSNIKFMTFFSNGINTATEGLDLVFNYGPVSAFSGNLSFSLAGNWVLRNKIVGAPIEPDAIKKSGASILNGALRSNIETGRPQRKFVSGIEYNKKKINLFLNHSWIGSTRFQDIENGGPIMEHIAQEFSNALLTDVTMKYFLTKKLSLSFTVSNVFNTLPHWHFKPLDKTGEAFLRDAAKTNLLKGALTFNGRYPLLGLNGSQFSQLGTTFQGSLYFRF